MKKVCHDMIANPVKLYFANVEEYFMKRFIVYAAFFLMLCHSPLLQTTHAFNDDSTTFNKVILNLLHPTIREVFINYYGDELGNQIGLYNYEMQVLNITANKYEPVTVTLNVIPQIGAHNPIGDYELQFAIDNGGGIQLLSLKQLKLYKETINRFELTIPLEE